MKKVEITLDNVIKCKKCDHVQVCENCRNSTKYLSEKGKIKWV